MSVTSVAILSENTHIAAVTALPLRVSFSWTLAGNVIYAACQFGMLSVLAKLGSPSIVGQYALGLAITAPVFMLTNLQLRGVQATDARHEFGFADYFTLRLISTLLGTLVILLIAAFAAYDITTKTVIVLVACAKAIETISDVIAGHLQKFERLDQVARALMIRGAVSVAIFAAVFWATRNLITTVAALGLAWTAVIALYDFRVVSRLLGRHRRFFRFSLDAQKTLLSISWPLGVVMTLVSLNVNIPRYILEHKLGTADLGIFASLAYLATSASIVITALGQSASARLSRMFADRQFDAFTSLIRKFVLFGSLLGIIGVPLGVLFGRQLISILFRAEYADHINVFLVMIATTSVVAVGSFLGYGVISARSFKMPVLVVGSSVATTAIVSHLLVPKFGLMGAAVALLIASAVQAIGLAVLMNFEISRAQRRVCSSIAKGSSPDIKQALALLSKGTS
jgi:O-antigen/teichoic acid export membrane protein